MPASFSGFPPEALRFLAQLKRHNRREWFLAQRDTYERKVRAPMVELVLALGREMQPYAPELSFDPARAIFRIYRDVRFSLDRSPYKTNIAAVFRTRAAGRGSGAALYFSVGADEVEIAGGVYMPDPAALLALRRHVAAHHQKLRAILDAPGFRRLFGELWGEQLTRAPKGFPADHPAVDLLRYKHYLVDTIRPPRLAESPKFLPEILRLFRAMMPLVRFLNEPVRKSLRPRR